MSETDIVNIEWLHAITKGSRPETAEPWTIQRDGESWTLVTNGHLLVMTRGAFGCKAPPRPGFADGVLSDAPVRAPRAFPVRAAVEMLRTTPADPDTLPDCERCGNEGETECTTCDGVGVVECECICGHLHDRECGACKGSGLLPCECGRTPPIDDMARVAIGDAVFARALLNLVLPHLPDAPAEWRQDRPNKMASLRCGPWRVLIMPLRPDPELPAQFTVQLSEFSRVAPLGEPVTP